MLIYRIERIDNPQVGAFIPMDGPGELAQAQARREGGFNPFCHPEPRQEGLTFPTPDHVCGLPSLDAYRVWFASPTIRAAAWSGGTHHMRCYDLPDELVQVSMIQAVFRPSDALTVEIVDPALLG